MAFALISLFVGTAVYFAKIHYKYFRLKRWLKTPTIPAIPDIDIEYLNWMVQMYVAEGKDFAAAVDSIGGGQVIARLRENAYLMLEMAVNVQKAFPGNLEAAAMSGSLGPHAATLTREFSAQYWLYKTRTHLPSTLYQLAYSLRLYQQVNSAITAFIIRNGRQMKANIAW